jgi:hypothetical protein
MINKNMFYGDPTIENYRDMDIREIIREYLLTKGTWSRTWHIGEKPEPIHKEVSCKDLVTSGLFVYGLKDNPTNRKAVEYYCERWGHIHQIVDKHNVITVPADLWEECDKKNEEFTNGNDRKPKEA